MCICLVHVGTMYYVIRVISIVVDVNIGVLALLLLRTRTV